VGPQGRGPSFPPRLVTRTHLMSLPVLRICSQGHTFGSKQGFGSVRRLPWRVPFTGSPRGLIVRFHCGTCACHFAHCFCGCQTCPLLLRCTFPDLCHPSRTDQLATGRSSQPHGTTFPARQLPYSITTVRCPTQGCRRWLPGQPARALRAALTRARRTTLRCNHGTLLALGATGWTHRAYFFLLCAFNTRVSAAAAPCTSWLHCAGEYVFRVKPCMFLMSADTAAFTSLPHPQHACTGARKPLHAHLHRQGKNAGEVHTKHPRAALPQQQGSHQAAAHTRARGPRACAAPQGVCHRSAVTPR
jgi:hypothetical protein